MTKPDSTLLVFVVDRSGSMHNIAADMRGGFDTLIQDQKKEPGECLVTLARFDNEYELVFENKPLVDVPPLELIPRGGTALYDAMGRTIAAVGASLSGKPEEARPSKVLFVIVTDGMNNASTEFTSEAVSKMVKTQQDEFSWSFVFLGANQNVALAAQAVGIPQKQVMNYAANAVGAASAYGGLSHQVKSYRTSRSKGADLNALENLQASYNVAEANAGAMPPGPAGAGEVFEQYRAGQVTDGLAHIEKLRKEHKGFPSVSEAVNWKPGDVPAKGDKQ